MRRPGGWRGFTLLEAMVVVAIIAVVAALVVAGASGRRERGGLVGAAVELQALIHSARQNALATGFSTVVMVFPNFQNPSVPRGRGRVIVYEDQQGTLFSAAAPVNFGSYIPGAAAVAPRSRVIATVDLPDEVWVGPPDGQGGVLMPVPFERVPVGAACTFCGADRGAIAFNPKGEASFYAGNGPPAVLQGGSVSLYNPSSTNPGADVAANSATIRTVSIVAATGAVRVLKKG